MLHKELIDNLEVVRHNTLLTDIKDEISRPKMQSFIEERKKEVETDEKGEKEEEVKEYSNKWVPYVLVAALLYFICDS